MTKTVVQLAPYLTAASILEEYGIPRRTTLAAIERGTLPATRLPGSKGAYLVTPDAFTQWQSERAAKAREVADREHIAAERAQARA